MVNTEFSASQAVDRANGVTSWTKDMCLAFVRYCLHPPGAPMYLPDANAAWDQATQKETAGTPPAGAPVYFQGGAHGHIALSLGGGRIRSTDWSTANGWTFGSVGTATINDVAVAFFGTASAYRGWSRDYASLAIAGLEATSSVNSGIPPLPTSPAPAPPSQEDELMAITVLHPLTGKQVPIEDALWSMWKYILDGRDDPQQTADLVTQSSVIRGGSPVAGGFKQDTVNTGTTVAAIASEFEAFKADVNKQLAALAAAVAALPKG